jgi:hypothetical protein
VAPCPMGSDRCGTACTNITTDRTNCGACGRVCPGTVPCAAGACTCPAGTTRCGDACVDTQTSAANCGACGTVCPAGMPYCSRGACIIAPLVRYARSMAPAAITDYVNACGMPGVTTMLGLTDDGSVRVPLTFNFRYWAADLMAGAMVNVCSNGFISLDGVANSSLGGSVPSAVTPNATIAAFWGDNMNRASGQCIATVGAAPSRRQVFQWNDAHYCCTDDPAVHTSYEVILNEGGTIDVLYQRMDGTRSQSVGIENQTGTMGVSGCPDGTSYTCAPTTGMTVRYVPAP